PALSRLAPDAVAVSFSHPTSRMAHYCVKTGSILEAAGQEQGSPQTGLMPKLLPALHLSCKNQLADDPQTICNINSGNVCLFEQGESKSCRPPSLARKTLDSRC